MFKGLFIKGNSCKRDIKICKKPKFISHQFYFHKGWQMIGSIIFQHYIHLNPILKMVTVRSSKMLLTNHVPAWYHNPENHDLNKYCSENPKSKSAIYLVGLMSDSYLLAAINFSFLYNSMKINAVNNSNTLTTPELSNA